MNRNILALFIGLYLVLCLTGCGERKLHASKVDGTPKGAFGGRASDPLPDSVTLLPDPAPVSGFVGGFGIDYCGDDLEACANLGATWSRHTGVTTLILAKRALDEAERLNIKLILRMNQGDWGWDGRRFDYSHLEMMRPIFDHPALLGFYGLHEPLERFSMAELRQFYREFRDIVSAPNILLWHDIMRIPDEFGDGICDLCGVAANPHINDPHTGEAVNDWSRTDPRLEEASQNIINSSHSQVCALVQVYGGDGRNFLRMPLPLEYRENLRRIVEDHGIRCIANYSYYHNAYKQTLGQADQIDLQTAVKESAQYYFGH